MPGFSAKRCLRNGAIFLWQQHIRQSSRKFPIIMPNAAVISEEVLASQAGLQVLRQGGSATDAVVAMAACMQVLQPYTAGVGGDCFIIYYDARTKKVGCVDGSGRSPAALTPELAVLHKQEASSRKKWLSGFYATVPGAIKAWFHIASNHGSGKLCMLDLFSPAISLAKNGYPMDKMKHMAWEYRYQNVLRMPGVRHFLNDDKIPPLGETCINQPLAALLEGLAKDGPRVFYEGCVAKNLVKAVEKAGGVLSPQDLADHLASTEPLEVEPVYTTYQKRLCVYTTPLPTQGAILLETLNILDAIQLPGN
ncbi:scoloptoxin SSD14-like [Haemaphysalis longicornis]